MSHWDLGTTAGNLPPTVPTSFVTDSGTAIPAANILNVNGSNGVVTSANPSGSNNLVISLQNSLIGQSTTVGATTADILTVDLATAGTYTFEARISGYSTAGGNGVGMSRIATFLSDGVTATIIDDSDGFDHTSVPLIDTDANYIASGRNAVLRLLGEAGFTINWGAFQAYVFRGL